MVDERAMTAPDHVVSERLGAIRDAILEVGRGDVAIVAVTKGFDRSAIDSARRLGLTDVAENYAQELLDKADALDGGTNMHFIGRVQRNKIRKIAALVDLWHSVARPEILVELAKRAPGANILVQVRPHDDETKDGVKPHQLEDMLALASRHDVHVAGLMTIGVLDDPERTRAAFVEVDHLCSVYGLKERSMGMSGDYRDALAAGATMLRLGSALFGNRPQ